MSVMEVVQQQCDRDPLQSGELEYVKQVADTTEATASLATQKAVKAKVFKHMDEASRIRLRFSLLVQVIRGGVLIPQTVCYSTVPLRTDTALCALMILYLCSFIETLFNLYC